MTDTDQGATQPIVDEKVVNDYRVWKKNASYLYDLFVSTLLPWPSLTVQWFPDVETGKNDCSTVQRLLLGTQSAGQGDEYVRIAQFDHTKQLARPGELDAKKYDADLGEIGGYTNTGTKISITHKINHGSFEVNRARYMPQNPDLLGTIGSNGSVYVFDRTKHPSEPTANFRPEITLEKHTGQGFGLSWNTQKKGHLLSAAEDGIIAHWDITQIQDANQTTLNPLSTVTSHSDVVNDVTWHPAHDCLYVSCSDDNSIQLHDTRDNGKVRTVTAQQPLSLALSPANPYLLACASQSGDINLWDIRFSNNNSQPLATFSGHSGPVVELAFSPFHETILASASEDRTVNIWDASQVDQGDKPLLFTHAGHMDSVNAVSWDPSTPWTLASTASDNSLHVWRVADTIVGA
uniref:ARAD1C09086p n=1 Tax=Blastobotrys adeninivorans TaxID=409370 RepID=A0A060T5X8_BLAAD